MVAVDSLPAGALSRRRPAALAAKRVLDVVGALVLLVLLAPLMLAIAIAIRAGSGSPVLFRHERVGLGGRLFRLAKFRTMVPDADRLVDELRAASADATWLLLERDPRVTRLGRVLRRLSLDELPQLVHVLRGQMSLVGPRPLSVRDSAHVPDWARDRVDVRPGLTGPWQVSGRTELTFEQMLHLDLDYVRRWSLWRDLGLLARTVRAVLTSRGAN